MFSKKGSETDIYRVGEVLDLLKPFINKINLGKS